LVAVEILRSLAAAAAQLVPPMRKFLLILAISVAIAILYGADTRAAPRESVGGFLLTAHNH